MNRILSSWLFIIGLLAPLQLTAAELELSQQQLANVKLTTVRVSAEENRARLSLSGTLTTDRRKGHSVAPVVDGVVIRLNAIEHARVRKGEVLAVLRSNSLGQAQADYLDALSRLELTESERKRTEGLWKEGIVAESRWLKADSEYKSARATFEARRRLLSLAGMSDRQIKALSTDAGGMAEFNLISPIDGMLTRVEIGPGQALTAGEVAFHVDDHSRLWAMVNIPVAALASVKIGSEGEVLVQARPGRAYRGRLESLGGEVDAGSQTLAGRIVVENTDGLLRPGMFAEIALTGAPTRGLRVPANAVFRMNDASYVFKVSGPRRYAPVKVNTGAVSDAGIVITGGLATGDEIVNGGVAELKSHWQYQGGE